jgi:hypothetical protein
MPNIYVELFRAVSRLYFFISVTMPGARKPDYLFRPRVGGADLWVRLSTARIQDTKTNARKSNEEKRDIVHILGRLILSLPFIPAIAYVLIYANSNNYTCYILL